MWGGCLFSVLFCFLLFEIEFLCSPGFSGTYSVDQCGLELASTS